MKIQNDIQMKNLKKEILSMGAAFFTLFSGMMVSCSDSASDHYKVSPEVAGRTNLWELISQQPELSVFAGLIASASYDRILSSEQSYTVWAPENEALTGIDPNDSVAVRRLVSNHVARYEYPASAEVANIPVIYMLSAKKMRFSRTGDAYSMHGVELAKKNLAAKNGILHTLKKQLAFEPSLWQYMESAEYDSIRSYMYSFTKWEFSRSASKPVDYNEEGMIVYDSVFFETNPLWYVYTGARGVGWLNNEDSIYTMIVPDNKAWIEAYNRNFDYYKPDPTIENPDSAQNTNTCYSIVQDLVFRGEINPASYGRDTLFSTRFTPFLDPVRLFSGNNSVRVSNGWVYPSSHMNDELYESCIKPIKVEAEMAVGRWHSEAQDFGRIRSLRVQDVPDVSSGGYLEVLPVSSSVTPSVSFELPNVLAAEYDIYCVLLAQSYVENIKDTTQYITRLRFEIQQWDRVTDKARSEAWKTVQLFMDETTSRYLTQGKGISNISVTEKFQFPFANYNEPENVFRIKVSSVPSSADRRNPLVIREMRIDYVYLEASR